MRRTTRLLTLLAFPWLVAVAPAAACVGDCDGDGMVTVDEILDQIAVVLGVDVISSCPAGDGNDDGILTVDEIVTAINYALTGCPAATPSPLPTATATATPIITAQFPPTQAAELRDWLEAGTYKTWTAESTIHRSGGPHGGTVRTYLNDIAIQSLTAGNASHPRGTALVKELYFGSAEVQEWAVEIKLEDDSAGGANWYWYEGAGLSGRGLGICTGCHRADYRGFTARDFVLTPFPLQ